MRKRAMQEGTLPEVFPTKKKRTTQGKANTNRVSTSSATYTKLKQGPAGPASSNSDSGPEIIWDNNSPSPAKEPLRKSKRVKAGRNVNDLLKKLSSNNKPIKDNKSSEDHSLFDIWMKKNSPTQAKQGDIDNKSQLIVTNCAEEKVIYQGKTPRRLVGRQRSRLQRFDPEFQDELCKLVMALSGPQSEIDKDESRHRRSQRRSVADKEDLDIGLDLFVDDIEPFDFSETKPKHEVATRVSQDPAARTENSNVSPDMFSDDDFDDIVISAIGNSESSKESLNVSMSNRVNTTRHQQPQKVFSAHENISSNQKSSLGDADLCPCGEDLFDDEDFELSAAVESFADGNSNCIANGGGKNEVFSNKCMQLDAKGDEMDNRATLSWTQNKRQDVIKDEFIKTRSPNDNHITHQAKKNTTSSNSKIKNGAINYRDQEIRKTRSSSAQSAVDFGDLSQISKVSSALLEDTPEDDEMFLTLPLNETPMSSTQKYNERQIQEKKRLALERLAEKKRKESGFTKDVVNRRTRQR